MHKHIVRLLGGLVLALVTVGFGIGAYQAQAKTGVACVHNNALTCEVFAVSPAGGKDRAAFKLYDENGVLIGTVTPYGLYKGSVVIRRGDTDGDGKLEFVTVPGDAGTTVSVKVWSADTAALAVNREATIAVGDGTMNKGARLVVADLDGDGTKEIIVSVRASGNDTIYVYQYQSASAMYAQVYTMDAAYAKTNLQKGDVDADGKEELVVSPSNSAGDVRVYRWDGTQLVLQKGFSPFGDDFAEGVRVRVGNVLGDAKEEVIVTPRENANPNVKVYGWNGTTYVLLTSFMAYGDKVYGTKIQTGVALRLGNIAGDGYLEIVTAPWQDGRAPLRVWQATNGKFRTIGWKYLVPASVQGLNLVTRDIAPDRVGTGHEEIIVAPRGRGGPILMTLRYNPKVSGNLEVLKRITVFHPKFRAEVRFDADAD